VEPGDVAFWVEAFRCCQAGVSATFPEHHRCSPFVPVLGGPLTFILLVARFWAFWAFCGRPLFTAAGTTFSALPPSSLCRRASNACTAYNTLAYAGWRPPLFTGVWTCACYGRSRYTYLDSLYPLPDVVRARISPLLPPPPSVLNARLLLLSAFLPLSHRITALPQRASTRPPRVFLRCRFGSRATL